MNLQKRLMYLIAAPLITVLLASSQLQANVTGKISGAVVNAETGEPVAGATVAVASTNLVTKADDDGEY
ncbi:MAG: hypothetical protein NTW07_09510, partial [candidate division Zixibacteria bacterium]|nr:hypothetical protein [candidate division Zixibacteria bacterium]